MTTVCGGGTSHPRQFSPAVIFLSGEFLAATVSRALRLNSAWSALIGFAAGQTVNVTTLCSTDPPAIVWPTAAEIIEIITGQNLTDTALNLKLVNIVLNGVWWAFCECDGVAMPAPPTVPPYPTDAPTINPPGDAPPTGLCYDKTAVWHIAQATTTATERDLTADILPTGPTRTVAGRISGSFLQAVPFPPGANNIVYKAYGTGSGDGPRPVLLFYDSSGALLLETDNQFSATHTGSTIIPEGVVSNITLVNTVWPPANAAWWAFSEWTQNSGSNQMTSDWDIQIEIAFHCAPATGLQAPCCPPDPTLLAKLERLESWLALIYSGLTTLPSSYSEGAVHAGLTGHGSFLLTDPAALGARVTCTTVPASYGRIDPSTPQRVFELGFVSAITAEAPIAGTKIEYADQLIPLPHLTEQIGYSLGPGVVATITEITRGP